MPNESVIELGHRFKCVRHYAHLEQFHKSGFRPEQFYKLGSYSIDLFG